MPFGIRHRNSQEAVKSSQFKSIILEVTNLDLVSPHPFWPLSDGIPASYPPLRENESCDVLVIGAGITGALVAELLSREHLDVVVLDRRDVAQGSTAATTGMLQYEIDVPLSQLIEKVGRKHAQRAYQLCLDSIDGLEALVRDLPQECGFERKQSLYAASRRRDVAGLQREYEARLECGIEVEFVAGPEVQRRFHLDFPAILLSPQAAVCDAYRMTHALLAKCQQRGVRIYDRTEVRTIRESKNEIHVVTDRGPEVRAGKIIHATGYEARPQRRSRIVTLKSTYAMVTQPLFDFGTWDPNWIFWESARPYFYLRTTSDQRLLVGGEDDSFRNPKLRDQQVARKGKKLLKRLQKMIPNLELEIEYAWAGTFGETADGLAYIGATSATSRAFYALGFGGNGITFSFVAASILRDLILGRPNSDAEIFRFNR